MEKDVFRGNFVRVTTEQKDAGDRIISFERVYLLGSVHIFVVTHEGKLRLTREHIWHEGNKVREKIPAGILEAKEAPLEAAQRELKEELGITATSWEPFIVQHSSGAINDERHYLIARDLTMGEPVAEESQEIVGYVDYGLEELFEKAVLEDIFSPQTVAAITKLYVLVQHDQIRL